MVQSRNDGERRAEMGGRWDDEHQTFERTAWKLPDGVSALRVAAAGNRKLNVMPYLVGEGNPYCDPGLYHYERTFFVHRNIGPNQNVYTCPAKTAKLRCPICEYAAKCGDPKTAKALQWSERQLWYVRDEEDASKGIQIWDYSYHLFGKQLRNIIKLSPIEMGFKYFADPKNGKILLAGFVEKPTGFGKPCYEVGNIIFMPRQPLRKADIQALAPLDDLLIIKTFDELREIFMQTTEPEAAAEPEQEEAPVTHAPRQQGRRPDPAPAADADDWSEQAVQPAPKAKSKAAPPPAEEPEGDWDEPAAPAPAPAAKRPAKAPTPAPAASEGEGWDDEPEAAPVAPTPAKRGPKPKPAPEPVADEGAGWDDPPAIPPTKAGGKKKPAATPPPAAGEAADDWE